MVYVQLPTMRHTIRLLSLAVVGRINVVGDKGNDESSSHSIPHQMMTNSKICQPSLEQPRGRSECAGQNNGTERDAPMERNLQKKKREVTNRDPEADGKHFVHLRRVIVKSKKKMKMIRATFFATFFFWIAKEGSEFEPLSR